jgi:hypothetical protein
VARHLRVWVVWIPTFALRKHATYATSAGAFALEVLAEIACLRLRTACFRAARADLSDWRFCSLCCSELDLEEETEALRSRLRVAQDKPEQ